MYAALLFRVNLRHLRNLELRRLNAPLPLMFRLGESHDRDRDRYRVITCHGTGAVRLFGDHGTVIDVGGQDTKVIQIKGGRVAKFAMNDKCAAGTGRFLEIMADRLGISQQQMADLARSGEPTKISSMCTVFAESEVISLIGRGEPRENIARGVIDSVVSRVATMAGQAAGAPYYLTGGLCENAFVVERLGELLGSPVTTSPQARFAGAIGAAIRAQALN